MVRKFNEFIIINESFNSPNLKRIIMDNGLPKDDYEKKILHDTTDNDVVEVLDSVDEFNNKYGDKGGNKFNAKYFKKQYYYIELENGKVLVLNNLDTFKDVVETETGQSIETLFDKIEKKYKERHPGKQKDVGDDIHRKHQVKVDKIISDKLIKRISEDKETLNFINNTINNEIKDYIDEYDDYDNDLKRNHDFSIIGIELKIYNEKYTADIYGNLKINKYLSKTSRSAYTYEYEISLNEVEQIILNNKQLDEIDITSLYAYPDNDITRTEEQDEIRDYYAYNGVRREDFI